MRRKQDGRRQRQERRTEKSETANFSPYTTRNQSYSVDRRQQRRSNRLIVAHATVNRYKFPTKKKQFRNDTRTISRILFIFRKKPKNYK